MTARRLAIVDDTFEIQGRGLVVAPNVDLADSRPQPLVVELRRPDGTRLRVQARAEIPMFNPPLLDGPGHALVLASVHKDDVPAGTEIWTVDD